MADDEDSSQDKGGLAAEPRDKNLQVKVTATYQAAVQVLAKAKGHRTISDYLQALLDAEIEAASDEIDELDNAIDERKAREADREKASLRTVLSDARSLVAIRSEAAAS